MKKLFVIDWWKIGILLPALILRVYRISELTEFLGDQGRTMLIMRDFLERGVIPLVGPTTLSGHNLGPIFYYLLAPGYLMFGGDPIGVSVWVAILGTLAILVLYETAKRMFGLWPARTISVLWAVSPYIIRSDRVIWEPNMVPLFSLLFVYLLYRGHHEQKALFWTALGATSGVLVQLHYPTVFFAGLFGVYTVSCIALRIRKLRRVLLSVGLWLVGFIAVLVPFLWYEGTVGFRDITGIISVMSSGGGEMVGKRVMADLWVGYAFRVIGRALPYMSRAMVAILLPLWLGFTVLHPTKKNLLLTFWFFGGLTPMARFSWVVHDHYLFFLLPAPFLMIASVLSYMKRPAWRYIAVIIFGIVSVIQFVNIDIGKPGRHDIDRVSAAVQRIREEVGDDSFSFTLTKSKSFSDLHYRYYMEVMGLMPKPITDDYQKLVLVCDETDCPSPKAMVKEVEVRVLCFEAHCSGQYPRIALLRDWKYMSYREVSRNPDTRGRIYVFQRRVTD